MLFFFEIKKLIKNRAVSALMVLSLALVTAASVHSANGAKPVCVDADEAREAFETFYADTQSAAETALRTAEGKYSVTYYSRVIENYKRAADEVRFDTGDVSGWDELLCFDLPFFAALFIAVTLGAASFYEDERIRMAQIISASKKGRGVTAADRFLASVTLSVIFVLAASLVAFACFRLSGLVKNGAFALQSAPSFLSSAEKLSLIRAFMLLTLRRCLVCAAASAGACLASKLLNGYIPIILTSAAFPVLEFAAFSIRYNAVDVFVKNVNMFAFGGGYLLKRWYCVRFFGASRPEPIAAGLALALTAVCFALCVLLPERRKTGETKRVKFPVTIELPRVKARPHKLFSWEFVKLLRTPAVLLPVCACLVLGVAGILKNYPVKPSAGESLYRAYCEEFSGRPLYEVYGIISEEESRINMGINRMDEADALYEAGRMSFDEYNEISREYIDCLVREAQLPALRSRLEYLIRASAEQECDLEFVYDTGYNKLFGMDAGFLPMLAVLVISSCPFMKERESGAMSILRTYKHGRRKLYMTRLFFVAVCTAAVVAVFSAAELYALSGDGIFDHLRAPAASLEKLRGLGALPLWSVLMQAYALRIAAALCAAAITFALSTRFESPFLVLAPMGGWMLVSFALGKLGVSFPPADLSAFLSGSAALVSSGTKAWLLLLPILFITAASVACSYKSYIRSGRRPL